MLFGVVTRTPPVSRGHAVTFWQSNGKEGVDEMTVLIGGVEVTSNVTKNRVIVSFRFYSRLSADAERQLSIDTVSSPCPCLLRLSQ